MCPLSRTCWLEQKIECPFYNREESGPLKSHRFSGVLINPIEGRGGLPVGLRIPTIGYYRQTCQAIAFDEMLEILVIDQRARPCSGLVKEG
jgi:hypothetical protein